MKCETDGEMDGRKKTNNKDVVFVSRVYQPLSYSDIT